MNKEPNRRRSRPAASLRVDYRVADGVTTESVHATLLKVHRILFERADHSDAQAGTDAEPEGSPRKNV
jgi:hypothetical protein